MLLVRRQSFRFGNDVWGVGGKVRFFYVCPRRRFFNFWEHTPPTGVESTGA